MTGAPGSGKTSILRALHAMGYAVVGEAATDVIAAGQSRGEDEPWASPLFIDKVVSLQRDRQRAARDRVQVYDRSPLCTLALARYLGLPVTPLLAGEVSGMARLYEREVFFVRPIGFVEPTAARRISYCESLAFGRLHEAVYAEHGFRLVDVPPAPVAERAALIARHLTGAPGSPPPG